MGIEAVALGAMAAGSIIGGINANEEAKDQARLVLAEGEREAKRTRENLGKFMSEQEASYAKSGVILEGSPLLVLEDTRKKGLEDVANIRQSARARANALETHGRNQLFGSLISGGSQAALGAARMGGKTNPTTTGGNGGYSSSFRQTGVSGHRYASGSFD